MVTVHTGLCICSGRIWESPKCLPLANLEAMHKQELKGNAKLQISWLSAEAVPQHTQNLLTNLGDLQAFKETSVQ